MKLSAETKKKFIALANEKGVRLEGNILKVLDADDDEFKLYLDECLARDRDSRKKRLEITKRVQSQNVELQNAQAKLQISLEETENARKIVEQDLSILQKKTQFRLMHRIVNVALGVVVSVGVLVTAVYILSLIREKEMDHAGNVWASLMGILLTNSFSILGTIMGVKYASDQSE